nr:hypothetical protein [uncultured Bacteroides sp.]
MFNSKEYEFADLTVVLGGRDITGIRSLKYSSKQEKEAVYAKGNKPHSIQRGNKSYEPTIGLLQSELEAIIASSPNKDPLDISFNIVAVYGNPSKGDAIVTDVIKNVEFTEIPKSLKQGDKFMEIELPAVATDIEFHKV